MPRFAARSPISEKSAAARSMPPRESGETLLHTKSWLQPSSPYQVELALGAGDGAGALRLGHALEVAERLKGEDLQAEPFHHAGDVARRAVEGQEIGLEDLDAVEPGRRDRLQLLGEPAAERDRSDGGLYGSVLHSASAR
jgi:hypothetical protein